MNWKLIVPPEDWQHPLELDASQLPLLEEIARRLALRITRDDQRGKHGHDKTVEKIDAGEDDEHEEPARRRDGRYERHAARARRAEKPRLTSAMFLMQQTRPLP